jgi:Xaa-Pro aminopeptidase
MKTRVNELRKALELEQIDALLVSNPENRRYLSGFSGSAGYLIISSNKSILATDFRYIEQAGRQSPDFEIIRIGGNQSWLSEILKTQSVNRLGFESDNLTVAQYETILNSLKTNMPNDNISLVGTSNVVEILRSIKDADEMVALTKAIEISDQAFTNIAPTISEGQTEKEIAWLLEKQVRILGGDAISFDTIVASGPNAALPHHRPSEKTISKGEPIIIDMGALYQGYCSDLSRTIFIGEPDDTFKKIYDIVLGAQLTAIATVENGMSGQSVDGLARTVIDEAGYGDEFGHSLGHGVGLAVHENPSVGPNSTQIIEEGMPFTIEPGIYISGWGGVRIEDIVVIENRKARVISNAPKYGMLGG